MSAASQPAFGKELTLKQILLHAAIEDYLDLAAADSLRRLVELSASLTTVPFVPCSPPDCCNDPNVGSLLVTEVATDSLS